MLASLPDDLLRCISDALPTDRDRANLVRTCPALRFALPFLRITLSNACTKTCISDALRSGRCTTLAGAAMNAELLDAVGTEFPERVDQLQEARVEARVRDPPMSHDGGLGSCLSVAKFPALKIIRMVCPVLNPNIEDPRILVETAIVDCARMPVLLVASGHVKNMQLMIDGLNEANMEAVEACMERAHASGVRVERLHIGAQLPIHSPQLADRLAAAATPLASSAGKLCCTHSIMLSLALARHVPAGVSALELYYGYGMMVALEQRLRGPVALNICQLVNLMRDDDLAALHRMIESGCVTSMDLEALIDAWGPITSNMRFLRRVPKLHIGAASVKHALDLVAHDQGLEARCVDLTLQLRWFNDFFNETNLQLLATCLAQWPHLRQINMRYWPDNGIDALCALFQATVVERSGGRIRVTGVPHPIPSQPRPRPQSWMARLCTVQ